MVPIQVKAQALRRLSSAAHAAVWGPFAIMPDNLSGPTKENEASQKRHWRQSDIKRALAAAQQAGLPSYRVEISPDGTISIVVGDPADTANPDSCNDPPES
jgi:hypothetical protein